MSGLPAYYTVEDLPTIIVHYIFLYLQVDDFIQCRMVSKLFCEIAEIAAQDIIVRLCKKYYPSLLYSLQEGQVASSALRSAIPSAATYFRRGVYRNNFSLLRELASHRIVIIRAFIVYTLPIR